MLDNFELLHEYNLLLQCRNHKNVIEFLGYFLENGNLTIVIEYAQKGDMNHELQSRKKAK